MSTNQSNGVTSRTRDGIFSFLQQVPLSDPNVSFKGKNILVTGANTGLGFEAANKFVALDASRVILGVRDLEKGNHAKSMIEERTGKRDKVEVWKLDMNSYDSIREFASRASDLEHLDVAVLNAGVYMVNYEVSNYGWEETLQVNVLSTTLLGLLLIPKLRSSKTPDSLPVLEFVSSGNHEKVTLSEEQRSADSILQMFNKADTYNASLQYRTSKLFLMYSVQTIARLAKSPNSSEELDFLVTSVCPGYCQSDLSRGHTGFIKNTIKVLLNILVLRTTEEGSRTLVSGTTLGQNAHGRFWQNDILKQPSPLLVGDEGGNMRQKTWKEIVEALKKDNPDINEIIL
ncbi:hypothetical protein B7463_g5810, partial [Scytalidium lignicola]